MKFAILSMRLISTLVISLIFGSAIGYGLDLNVFAVSGVIAGVSIIPMIPVGSLVVLVGSYTGQVAYSGSIETPIARLMIDAISATALGTVTGAKLTLTQATKRKLGTIIPELSFGILADIAGFIDAIYFEYTAAKRIIFSIPISLGGAYDLEGGSLDFAITNCQVADTFKINAIDDARREFDYIDIVPVSCPAGAAKVIDAVFSKFLFIDPTNLSRIKVNYGNGIGIEYTGEEIKELARVVNPVQKVTDTGVLVAGYNVIAGINVADAVSVEVTAVALGLVYMVKHMSA